MLYAIIVASWLAAVVLGWRCGAAWQKFGDRRDNQHAGRELRAYLADAEMLWTWPLPPHTPPE